MEFRRFSAKEAAIMDETLQILQMLEKGTISADEAHRLLGAVRPALDKQPESVQHTATEPPSPAASAPDFRRYRLLSYIPLAGALVILFLSGWGAYVLYRHAETRITAGFVVVLIVAVLALLLAALTLWMATVPWLHVRIRDHTGHRIAISLPLPLRLAYWGLHLARRFVHDESTAQLDAAAHMIQAVRTSLPTPTREPIAIDVDDDGERVQVYIG
jgi:hypothetical protein